MPIFGILHPYIDSVNDSVYTEFAPVDLKSRQNTVDVAGQRASLYSPSCECLADFFREEFLKHHACLNRQREYYSEVAIAQVEDALASIVGQLDQLCRRHDACQMMTALLRKFDLVTKLSAWTEPDQLH
ncbi:MAG: hypothetical protein ABI051_19210 [Vicinamibacterales bacterium]